MHPALNVIIKAARRASQIINRSSSELDHLKVTTKRQSDFVTEVDKAAEAAIIEVLREADPEYGILQSRARPPDRAPAANTSDHRPARGTMASFKLPNTRFVARPTGQVIQARL
jgi:3'-phosphoadenosine 5'-phosphosulfate (PAPS) 3'-phosphatase